MSWKGVLKGVNSSKYNVEWVDGRKGGAGIMRFEGLIINLHQVSTIYQRKSVNV
jgi:hypothetical protein